VALATRPAQLALLTGCLTDSRLALAHWQAFKWEVIARLPRLGRIAPDLGRDFKRMRQERTLGR
jgi:hypothetical protein